MDGCDPQTEAERLRQTDQEFLQDLEGRSSPVPSSQNTFLAVTTHVTTYPATANCFYALHPVVVLGTETEGVATALTTSADIVYGYNVGSGIPPEGQTVICSDVAYRLIFQYDGATS